MAELASSARLAQQLAFICEIDQLKTVLRQTRLISDSRRENSAEHSWHLGLMAMVLAEYAPDGADPQRVARMVLVHDIVEIDAGDTFAFDEHAYLTKADRELAAADRIFGLLPPEQGQALRALWDEFELETTPDARYANALDRLEPLLMNYHNGGGTWKQYQLAYRAVLRRLAPIEHGTPELWPYTLALLETVVAAGYIVDDRER